MKKKVNIKEKINRFKAWLAHVLSSCAKFCREKINRFKAWRERPRQIAPMTQEEHECLNCHDHYTGRFCPRCGQAATTSRFSMKVAAENFAEAYGMGERGMFRTMRDLILRPGYLILDYLRGLRVSYFAPFKMFFLLFALSLFVTHGLNIKRQALYNESESAVQELQEEVDGKEETTAEQDVLEINGETTDTYLLYKQTHTLDGAEFGRLIDGTVEDCAELGIETLPPAELEAMYAQADQAHRHTESGQGNRLET